MNPRLLLLAITLATPTAWAHDTWFQRLDADGHTPRLALGTGNQFPQQETGIDTKYIVESACRAARITTTLKPGGQADTALHLRATPGASTCWAQTAAFEVTLDADKIAPYLREVNASAEQRATWAALQQRGLPWRERYVKHARIELGAPSALPAPLGLDLVIEHPSAIEPGQTFTVRALRDGQPLPGLAVELRSEDSPLGIWRRSDEAGRLTMPAPSAGRWLLRAIDLRLSTTTPDTWDSRFATTAFEIGAVQNGSSFSSNALSTNQAAANAVISSEPPSSTTRR
jgi:Domain of unknown function (DUF4198)